MLSLEALDPTLKLNDNSTGWVTLWSSSSPTLSVNGASTWQVAGPLAVQGTNAQRVRFVATFPPGASADTDAAAFDDVHFNSDCTSCPAGRYNPEIASGSCAACPSGSFCATAGLTSPTELCNSGTYANSGASTCTSCAAGTYQVRRTVFHSLAPRALHR